MGTGVTVAVHHGKAVHVNELQTHGGPAGAEAHPLLHHLRLPQAGQVRAHIVQDALPVRRVRLRRLISALRYRPQTASLHDLGPCTHAFYVFSFCSKQIRDVEHRVCALQMQKHIQHPICMIRH